MSHVYARTYDRLDVCCLTPEQHERTCNYWYTVTNFCTAHTAFETIEGLTRWLDERGLRLAQPLPAKRGEHFYTTIVGAYREAMHQSYDEFFALQGVHSRTWSNGDITLAIITHDDDGLRTVHTLNPNCRDRPVFNTPEARAALR